MPFCEVGEYNSSSSSSSDGDGIMASGLEEGCVQLFYQLFGHGDTKVLLIPGVAATYEAWGPQVLALCGTVASNEEEEEARKTIRRRRNRSRSKSRDFTHFTHSRVLHDDDDDDGHHHHHHHHHHDHDAIAAARSSGKTGGENRGAAAAASSRTGVQFCGAFDDENYNRGVAGAAAARSSSGTGVQVCAGTGVQVCGGFDDENYNTGAKAAASSRTVVQVSGGFDDENYNRGVAAAGARSSGTGVQVCVGTGVQVCGGFDDENHNTGAKAAASSATGVQVCGGFDDENYNTGAKAAASSGTGVQVCAFDNRGVGRSSAPKRKKSYMTSTMAKDALALMDHLGWNKAHVVGHSMGGMIACKLGAIAPERVISLALISTTGGGYECLPKIDKTMISIAYRFFRAKTPEERAHVDLDTHYTKEYLDTLVDEEYRRATLYREYVKNLSSSGMQPKHGLDGQFNACWNHNVKSHEIDRICSAGISVAVIHGRGDIVAQIQHAQKLAKKLHPVASMTELTGGHMVTHQNAHEVNKVLLELITSERVHVRPSTKCNNHKALHDVHSWEIWQKCSTGIITNKDGGGGFVGSVAAVVELIDRLFPDWFSLLHVFPTLYWPLLWAKYYFSL